MKSIYISGKVTGDRDYYAKFENARYELILYADAVISPAILPPKGFDHSAYMRMAAAMLTECEAVYMLPDWQDSPGAQQEHQLAKRLGKRIFYGMEDLRGA